jgi:hypothetical protein
MKANVVLGAVSLHMVLMLAVLSFAEDRPIPLAASTPTIEGTYKLISRRLPDGTMQLPSNIVGLMTYTKHYRSLQIMWTEPDGKIYSLSSGAIYELTPKQYTETLLFITENDQISGKGTRYNLSSEPAARLWP